MQDYMWLAHSFTWDLWLPVGLVGHPAGAGSGWGKQSPLSQILVLRCSRVSSCSLQGGLRTPSGSSLPRSGRRTEWQGAKRLDLSVLLNVTCWISRCCCCCCCCCSLSFSFLLLLRFPLSRGSVSLSSRGDMDAADRGRRPARTVASARHASLGELPRAQRGRGRHAFESSTPTRH